MKNVYVYGAHVKIGYDVKINSLAEISSKVKSRNQDIASLMNGHRWRFRDVVPIDECNARSSGLLQWCEHVSGSESKNGTWCRIALMNDEVLWQWRSGSVLTYRFDSLKDSLEFYMSLFPKCDVKFAKRSRKYEVGDVVRLNHNVVSLMGYTYEAGDVFRVYDVKDDCVVPTGVDGKTYIRIPGTGGSKLHIGYCYINWKDVSMVKEL